MSLTSRCAKTSGPLMKLAITLSRAQEDMLKGRRGSMWVSEDKSTRHCCCSVFFFFKLQTPFTLVGRTVVLFEVQTKNKQTKKNSFCSLTMQIDI